MSTARRRLAGAGFSVVVLATVTGAIFGLRSFAPVLSLGVLYVFAVLSVAVLWGLAYSVVVAVASMLAFNWFFLPPAHTLALRDSENWVALAVYLVTAVVVSALAADARRRAREAREREREAAFAAEVSALLLESGHVQDRLGRIATLVSDVLGVGSARIELESVRRPEPHEQAVELSAGQRRVGTLFVPRGSSRGGELAARIVAILAALLASAVDRERLGLKAVEAEALQRSDAVKTTILRTLSHDLRSPLTAITVSSEVLERDAETLSAAERGELIASVRLEAARLHRLVSNLLDLSRIEVGAVHPRPELWTVEGLVSRALDALGPDARRVAASLPAADTTVRVDPAQLERVLVNLLENALKWSSPTDRVEVRAAREARELVLRVVDRGPGLPAGSLQRIFEPFEYGPAPARGTGLGLAIARGFTVANGGRLWAESTPGHGATFVLALPVADVPAPLRA